jgi:uncharacterized membrane protein
MAGRETAAPPVGEELHLPEPSLVPILNAVGVSLALIGLTVSYIVTAIGLVLFLFTLVRWIRDSTREMSELPAEHRGAH